MDEPAYWEGRSHRLQDAEAAELRHSWPLWARDAQLPPAGDWTTWLLMGGRGAGKTRTGAEWVQALATGQEWAGGEVLSPIALVSETVSAARAVMVEGVSGLTAIAPETDRPVFHAGRNRLEWPNGAMAQLFGAHDPESLRGPQFAAAWCDEAGRWSRGEAAFDMLQFGLRLGPRPRQLVTTTPRPVPLIKRLLADPQTAVTRMPTKANRANLAPAFLDAVTTRYRGTVLGRQELDGELIEDDPLALWNRVALDAHRVNGAPACRRVVVAVDPPVTGHQKSDRCGIVVAGVADGRAYVMADRSVWPAPPLVWARRVAETVEAFEADCVVAEVNQGGELVTGLIRQVAPAIRVKPVRANRGKWVRAEPVAALYARGLVSHCGSLPELEDEMCAFGPDGLPGRRSPDRLDALVWALTDLMLGAGGKPRVRNPFG